MILDYQGLWQSLAAVYDEREARAVARWLLDVVFGLSPTEVLCGGMERLREEELLRLKEMQQRLLRGEPVQYVAGVADFGPRQFCVEPGVLIPRPETYELCQWITQQTASGTHSPAPAILDIGTGSGCIACTLALDTEGARVTAWDVSEDALRIAGKNAERVGAAVTFVRQDALAPPPDSDRWDVIVSNPPYVCERERTGMTRQVLDHEPALALFVPDDDPLRFYRAIGRYALTALRPGGRLYFELNAAHATDTATTMEGMGMKDVELREDQYGHPRFLQATRP